ncbi:uncharacterized protein LOC113238415 [Hyposmocoma kahamanoa]|uniref:uncharacterized protein LOC113238415 n=1 Tax=Hyposmocoma kahamanoa TaxID=1477025 RepID=UPI000E6D8303|nr:uncharacterized protein LOC113238415 [Hyposmocoma kahamanoa]
MIDPPILPGLTESLRWSSGQISNDVSAGARSTRTPCQRTPHLCTMVPADVPEPGLTQTVLHPRKDVFVLKVAKVGPNGDKKCKMELELVTPKYNDQPPVYRVDTRETQCEPECPCCCGRPARRKKRL